MCFHREGSAAASVLGAMFAVRVTSPMFPGVAAGVALGAEVVRRTTGAGLDSVGAGAVE